MMQMLVLEDLNYVTRAFPIASIASITLEYDGTSPPRPPHQHWQPTVTVVLLNGEMFRYIRIPVVENPRDNIQVEDAVFKFFDRLARGAPIGSYGHGTDM